MSSAAAIALAQLAAAAHGERGAARVFFGVVSAADSTTVTVVPDDSMDGVVLGPIALVGSGPLAVADRALIMRTESGALACLGKVIV